MSGDPTVRRYRPGDGAAVRRLHERALRAAGTDPADVPGNEDLRDVRGEYLEAGGEFVVATVDGEVAAMGGYRPVDDTTVELFRMAVAPAHQREGLGSLVLAELEDRARADGHERAVLETAARQAAATAFYPARGYTETGRRTHGEYELLRFGKDL